MAVEKKLTMIFEDELGDKCSFYVDEPKEGLTETEIKTCMDLIVSKNIFMSTNAGDLVKPLEAKITSVDTTNFDLVID